MILQIIFRETRNKCLKSAVNRDFHYVFVVLDNHYYAINDIACRDRRLIPVATTWLVWFLVTFGQPSFSSSESDNWEGIALDVIVKCNMTMNVFIHPVVVNNN